MNIAPKPTYDELADDLKTARATIRIMDKNKAGYLARIAELESTNVVAYWDKATGGFYIGGENIPIHVKDRAIPLVEGDQK